MMKNIHIIINPQAKNGYSQKVWLDVEANLELMGIPYSAYFTEYRGHAKQIGEAIKGEVGTEETIIVVIGGDGTIHEVINGVVNTRNIFIGFIPGGSGNDFSRGYGIPQNPSSAFQYLLQHWEKPPTFVDVGKIIKSNQNVTHFINNMGAGFDALITKEANDSPLKKVLNRFSMGNLIYAYYVIKKLFTFQCTDITLLIDGKSHSFKNTWFVTVSNQPYYGGGMKISPDASVKDGLFNITVVHNLSRIKFLMVFITVFWGGHTRFKEVESFLGKEISIQSKKKLYVHADGEYIGETPLEIQAYQQIIPLLTKVRE
jgi:diacylglycerol kinase (ATP)